VVNPRTVFFAISVTTLFGCSDPVSVEVNIVQPCNQEPLKQLDYLRFVPMGQDIESRDLTSVYPVEKPLTSPIPLPLVGDFQLVVTGHRMDYTEPTAGIGVSPVIDLSLATPTAPVNINVPFGLVDEFYKTTNLAEPTTCTEMKNPRYGASATYLPEVGKVLIVGGIALGQAAPKYRRAIEMFDPSTGLFSEVGELKLDLARAFHRADLLSDGRVLITGGVGEDGIQTVARRTAFTVKPRDNSDRVTVSNPVNMRKPRTGHTTVALQDGRILLVGGRQLNPDAISPEDHFYLADVEVYDPVDGQFISPADPQTGSLVEMTVPRYGHSTVGLGDGNSIFVAGGFNQDGPQRSLDILEVTGDEITITATATMQAAPIFHSALKVSADTVLLSGGYLQTLDADPRGQVEITTVSNSQKTVEMWRFAALFAGGPSQLTRVCDDQMSRERGHHTSGISGRRAVFIGGHTLTGATTNTAESVYLVDNIGGKCFAQAPTLIGMSDSRAGHSSTVLPSGELLLMGGITQSNDSTQSLTSSEIFSPARNLVEFK